MNDFLSCYKGEGLPDGGKRANIDAFIDKITERERHIIKSCKDRAMIKDDMKYVQTVIQEYDGEDGMMLWEAWNRIKADYKRIRGIIKDIGKCPECGRDLVPLMFCANLDCKNSECE